MLKISRRTHGAHNFSDSSCGRETVLGARWKLAALDLERLEWLLRVAMAIKCCLMKCFNVTLPPLLQPYSPHALRFSSPFTFSNHLTFSRRDCVRVGVRGRERPCEGLKKTECVYVTGFEGVTVVGDGLIVRDILEWALVPLIT